MTAQTYSRPSKPMSADSVWALRTFLEEQRYDIVAVYHVLETYPPEGDQAEFSQEVLMFELRDIPELHAGRALYEVVGRALGDAEPPPRFHDRDGYMFSFPTTEVVPSVRAAVEPLWARDPTAPLSQPAAVELVYEAPDLPQGFVVAIQRELASWPNVNAMYAVTERLLEDDGDVWSSTRFVVEGDSDSRNAARALASSVREVISQWFEGHGAGLVPTGFVEPEVVRGGLRIYERKAPE